MYKRVGRQELRPTVLDDWRRITFVPSCRRGPPAAAQSPAVGSGHASCSVLVRAWSEAALSLVRRGVTLDC